MGKLIRSTLPCEDCGSSDALADYEDGTFCFSCKRYRSKKKEQRSYFKTQQDIRLDTGELQGSFSTEDWPKEAKLFLYKLYLDDDMINKNEITHCLEGLFRSKSTGEQVHFKNRIAIPFYDSAGSKRGHVARAYTKGTIPKAYTITKRKSLAFPKNLISDTFCVVVEDVISCIRLSYHTPACSLNGTSISDKDILNLKENYDRIYLWLDDDKPGQEAAASLKRRLSNFFSEVILIRTELDPKCYTNRKIKSILKEFII